MDTLAVTGNESTAARKPRKLTSAEPVAEMLGVKVHRVYDLARQDLIPHVKLGRQVRFDLEKVEAWLEAGGQALPGGWRQEAA